MTRRANGTLWFLECKTTHKTTIFEVKTTFGARGSKSSGEAQGCWAHTVQAFSTDPPKQLPRCHDLANKLPKSEFKFGVSLENVKGVN